MKTWWGYPVTSGKPQVPALNGWLTVKRVTSEMQRLQTIYTIQSDPIRCGQLRVLEPSKLLVGSRGLHVRGNENRLALADQHFQVRGIGLLWQKQNNNTGTAANCVTPEV